MKRKLLLTVFLILNALAALMAFTLWDSSSLAGGSVIIALWIFSGIGTSIGGWLASKNLYGKTGARLCFTGLAAAVPALMTFAVQFIDHPAPMNGPFPTNPWHEYGFVWLYIVLSTLWLLVQATRDA